MSIPQNKTEFQRDQNQSESIQQKNNINTAQRLVGTPPASAASSMLAQMKANSQGVQPFQMKRPTSISNGLPEQVQAKMENSMGHDFSSVNIHKESQSATDAEALAYAQGNDVHFAPGQFKPDTTSGQELIGHELAHVVQQREGRVKPTKMLGKGMAVNDDAGLEREADVMGKKAAQAKIAPPDSKSAGGFPGWGIQRKTFGTVPTAQYQKEAPKGSAPKEITPEQKKLDEANTDYATFVKKNYIFPNFTAGLNGKFDVNYQPAANLMTANIKVKFEFPENVKGVSALEAALFKQIEATYPKNVISQIQNKWSSRYSFQNIREPQAVWGKLNPTQVNVTVTEDNANPHFVFKAYFAKTGRSNVNGGNTGKSNNVEIFKDRHQTRTPFISGNTRTGEISRLKALNPGPILFDANSATIKKEYVPKLQAMATYLKRINTPQFEIGITGHSNLVKGGSFFTRFRQNILAKFRAQAVNTALVSGGVTNHKLAVSSKGFSGATVDPKWNKVEIDPKLPAAWQNGFNTIDHEFGHMVGLGDEYWQSAAKAPSIGHYPLVVKALGKEYADNVMPNGGVRGGDANASIMHFGQDVRIQHYVTFWDALCQTTTSKAGVPTPRLGHADWKFNE